MMNFSVILTQVPCDMLRDRDCSISDDVVQMGRISMIIILSDLEDMWWVMGVLYVF